MRFVARMNDEDLQTSLVKIGDTGCAPRVAVAGKHKRMFEICDVLVLCDHV